MLVGMIHTCLGVSDWRIHECEDIIQLVCFNARMTGRIFHVDFHKKRFVGCDKNFKYYTVWLQFTNQCFYYKNNWLTIYVSSLM